MKYLNVEDAVLMGCRRHDEIFEKYWNDLIQACCDESSAKYLIVENARDEGMVGCRAP